MGLVTLVPNKGLHINVNIFRQLSFSFYFHFQEVDHFNFLNTCLTAIGYRGVFCSKPDSPCIYVTNNNGPDGCALFYRKDKFDLISASSRILEIWRVQSNQVY